MENIKLSAYTFSLPGEKIASHGLNDRDRSKLLVYQQGQIRDQYFFQLKDHLPPNATLFFNNTKVIQARLILKRNTGAIIEVFLLAPANPHLSIYDTLNATNNVTYKCMIGNLKKWQENEILTENMTLNGQSITLHGKLIDKKSGIVIFSWNNQNISFNAIIDTIGHTPLPPYIKRPDNKNDKDRYQTVYSKLPGAVAAPTAGLHFTKRVLEAIHEQGIKTEYLTLHVSAGTFQPIKVDKVIDHTMHSEQIIVTKDNLQAILTSEYRIAVGTTAMRTLESTYWYGVKLLLEKDSLFHIDKLAPYQYLPEKLPDLSTAIKAVLDYMNINNLKAITGDTEIFILPGYDFKVCRGLITNFHQPGSTLILLVAAFVGNDWQTIYNHALQTNYRFLSYGDSSLLLK